MKYLGLLLILLAAGANGAQPPDAGNKSSTQLQMNASAGQEWKAADAALDKFYATYMKQLDPKQLELFKAVNSSWLKYREAYCKFEASGVQGGSAYPMAFAYCMASQSKERLRELRQLSRCRGDTNCPAWFSSVPNNSFQRTLIRYAASRR